MTQLKRQQPYQYGSLRREERKKGPDVWTFRFFTTDGSHPRVIVGSTDEMTEEEAWRACEHLQLAANREAVQPRVTMRGLLDRYKAEVLTPCTQVAIGAEQDEIAPKSYTHAKSQLSVLRLRVMPRWETYLVKDFERPEMQSAVEDWLRSLVRTNANPNGLAPKTVRATYEVMRDVFKRAMKWGYIGFNPMTDKRVELPRGSTKRLKQPVQLFPVQFFALVSALPLMETVAVAFAGWLGPRISEAFGLKWEDLDLIDGIVHFRRGFVQGRLTPLKTEASRTNLPLPEHLLDGLRAWRASTPFNADSDWVFASPYTRNGRKPGSLPYWPAQMMKTRIKPIALKLGLPSIGWHSFRHSLTAWGKEASIGVEQLRQLVRHEDPSTTARHYGKMAIGVKRELQQRLVAYVMDQAKAQGWNQPLALPEAIHDNTP